MSPFYRELRAKIGNDLLLIPGVAGIIRNDAGELLLQEKAGGLWTLPAGAIEPGESPEDALCREVLEETGLVVEPVELLGVFGGSRFRFAYPNGNEVEYTIVLFRCGVKEDTGGPTDSETVSLRYFAEETMPDLPFPYPRALLFGRNG
jgi:8-oxo-dGTP pyrophosphatase MutT (NUDIX family)